MVFNGNNIFLQGLVGLGLVGYNTVKTLIDAIGAESIQDYAEFFPNLSLIDNGVIENQCVRVYKKDFSDDGRFFHIMNGPQPRTDELSSFFLQKIIKDIDSINNHNKIDYYLSFGAYVTKNLSFEEENESSSVEELAEKILQNEIDKDRNLYVATSGQLEFDSFVTNLNIDDVIIKETQGFISGLNGVLPAMVGERLKIPTATIMVETTGTDSRSNNFPVLSQFLGLLATKKGLQFLNKVFDLNLDLESKIIKVLEELKETAKNEIITFLSKDINNIDRSRETDFRNDKMYI